MSDENTGSGDRPGAIVLAINICDTVIRDELDHKISLIGLFNRISASSFPCTHDRMHIYIAATGGHGKHKMTVRLISVAKGDVAMGMEGSIVFKNPLQVVEVNLQWRQVVFTSPGEYLVEVLCDGKMIGSRKFIVQQLGQLPKTDGSEVA